MHDLSLYLLDVLENSVRAGAGTVAVTIAADQDADTLTLARISTPGAEVTDRPVRSITTAPSGFEGEGFPVRRAFAGVDLAELDPFIHLDQMGEVEYAPGEPKGTPWHPHRGIETITYILGGKVEHGDSIGNKGVIAEGDFTLFIEIG